MIRSPLRLSLILPVAFAILGAPTCSDGRSTAEDVEQSVRRREAKARSEEVELAEIEAQISGEPVEVTIDPPIDWRNEVGMELFIERREREYRAEYVAFWLEPRGDGTSRRNLMKWTEPVMLGSIRIGSRSRGGIGLADLLNLGGAQASEVEDGVTEAVFSAAIPGGMAEAVVPMPPPLARESLIECVSWRAADGTGRGLVFIDASVGAQFDRLEVDFRGDNWGQVGSLWKSRGPVVAFKTPRPATDTGVLIASSPPLELPLDPFAGLSVERTSTAPFECEALVAAPDWVADRFPELADPAVSLGVFSARSEIRGDGRVMLCLWNAARPRQVAELEDLIPVGFSQAGSATFLLARRVSSTFLQETVREQPPYAWVSSDGALFDCDVDVKAGWRFEEFRGGQAVFTRRVPIGDEVVEESLAVHLPIQEFS